MLDMPSREEEQDMMNPISKIFIKKTHCNLLERWLATT